VKGAHAASVGDPTGDRPAAALAAEYNYGYTLGMKTAISIPDGVFKAAERLARRLKISRSELYATAVASFLERHAEKEITGALNEVYASEPSAVDPVLSSLQAASLPREDW